MKKLLLTIMIASLLALPFGTVALAENQESPASAQELNYVPGEVPAQTDALESMTPAIHAAVLSMLNQNASSFDCGNELLAWETLYNMLSLYGQMDDRAEYQDGLLVLPSETVMDYTACLLSEPAVLAQPPHDLADRMVYDAASDSFLLSCGDDSLAESQLHSVTRENGSLHITGSLVYLVDNSDLVSFQAVLSPRDNMFGYTISSLELL